jgi:hypothetical protein
MQPGLGKLAVMRIFLKKGREAREQDANTLIREEDTQMEMNGNE